MDIRFEEIVKTTRASCKDCFTLIYSLPCELDDNIASYMSSFGKPKYDLKTISLIHIESLDEYAIKGRIKNTYIKFSLPKKFEASDDISDSRKKEFESNIAKWLENKLQVSIIL